MSNTQSLQTLDSARTVLTKGPNICTWYWLPLGWLGFSESRLTDHHCVTKSVLKTAYNHINQQVFVFITESGKSKARKSLSLKEEEMSDDSAPRKDQLQERLQEERNEKSKTKQLRRVKTIEDSDSDSEPMTLKRTPVKYDKVRSAANQKTKKNPITSDSDSDLNSIVNKIDIKNKKRVKKKDKVAAEKKQEQLSSIAIVSESDSDDEILSVIALKSKKSAARKDMPVKNADTGSDESTGDTPLAKKKVLHDNPTDDGHLSSGDTPLANKILNKTKENPSEKSSVPEVNSVDGNCSLPSLDNSFSSTGDTPLAVVKLKGSKKDSTDQNVTSTPKGKAGSVGEDVTLVSDGLDLDSPVIKSTARARKSLDYDSESSTEEVLHVGKKKNQSDMLEKNGKQRKNTKRKLSNNSDKNESAVKKRKLASAIESESSSDDEICLVRTKDLEEKAKQSESSEEEIGKNNTAQAERKKKTKPSKKARTKSINNESESETSESDVQSLKRRGSVEGKNGPKSTPRDIGMTNSKPASSLIGVKEPVIVISTDTCDEENVVPPGGTSPPEVFTIDSTADSMDDSPIKAVKRPSQGKPLVCTSEYRIFVFDVFLRRALPNEIFL